MPLSSFTFTFTFSCWWFLSILPRVIWYQIFPPNLIICTQSYSLKYYYTIQIIYSYRFRDFLCNTNNLHKVIRFQVYIYLPVCTNRMLHKVKFMSSLTGINSKFSFSKTVCHTKAALLLTHTTRENNWIHTLPKGISAYVKCKQFRLWFKLESSSSVPTTVTITPWTSPKVSSISI